MLTNRLSIAIAAGLMLAGPALADDQDATRTQDQTKARDEASAGIGAQVQDMARAQAKGDGTTGIGDKVSEMAQSHGCDVNGSAECKAHHAVHQALADQAGAPTDRPSLPGEASGAAAEHHAARTRTMDTERAALRHTQRMAAQGQGSEAQAMHRGAGAGGHGMGGGMGGGMGDGTQAAETTRSGDMHHGAMGGTGGTGGTTGPGGMMK
ncbi:MAG TPA: hypothetical protein VLT47_06690 [Anaeromyxobacteraceae bacterium]|nr:hypothetical protein [Anaeromyxobacteraceae bacterium]